MRFPHPCPDGWSLLWRRRMHLDFYPKIPLGISKCAQSCKCSGNIVPLVRLWAYLSRGCYCSWTWHTIFECGNALQQSFPRWLEGFSITNSSKGHMIFSERYNSDTHKHQFLSWLERKENRMSVYVNCWLRFTSFSLTTAACNMWVCVLLQSNMPTQ